MQDSRLISIITASYNYENYIKETIESVLSQTYTNWELIIVDDGSKDNSVEVIKSYCEKDSRIKLFQHEGGVNKGLAETIKVGVSKAQGEWIAFLESDDKFMPECLEEKVKVINENPDVKFIFSDLETFGEGKTNFDKSSVYTSIKKKLKAKNPLMDLSADLLKQNLVCTFSIVMLQKHLIENCNFNTPVDALLDYWLWTQIVQETKFYYINKPLTMWRIHNKSFINNYKGDMDLFKSGILSFYKKINTAYFFAQFRKLKYLKQKLINIRTGKNAKIAILGKVLYQRRKYE